MRIPLKNDLVLSKIHEIIWEALIKYEYFIPNDWIVPL